MYTCSSGTIETVERIDGTYYRLRLNLVNPEAKTRKEKYRNKYIQTDLKVGNHNKIVAGEMLSRAIREHSNAGANTDFSIYCQNWIDMTNKRHDIEDTTKACYEYKAEYLVRYFKDSGKTLSDITTADMMAFQNSLYELPKSAVSQRKSIGLSERTIRDTMVVAKQIFKYATDNGHLTGRNPCASLKLPRKRRKIGDQPYINAEQLRDFRQILHEECSNKILEYAYLIGLFYGLRREEICGLKWGAVRDGLLFIEHTVTHMKVTMAKDRTKTEESNRCCAVLPEIQQMFDEIRYEQVKNGYNSDYIFTMPNGKPITPDYLTKNFKKIVRKRPELDDRLHLHDLRASCVSILIGNGVNIKDVQKWVGHRDIKTTMEVYARTNPERQYETALAMAGAMF